jgi:hypothetical protein
MRKPQALASRGSQRWIQYFVNEKPDVLNAEIADKLRSCASIQWLSPLKADEYAEYRDGDFLDRLCLKPLYKLTRFWPRIGPQWDAFGIRSDGAIILVEAKSHPSELTSNMEAKVPSSISKISDAFKLTKEHYEVGDEFDWTKNYYQYENGIAFLYYLNEKNKKPTFLLFLYFVNDYTMDAPLSVSEWKYKISRVKSKLGILGKSINNIAEIFIDVKKKDPKKIF